MKDNQKTNEGAQDLEGLQNFIFEVNTEGFDTPAPEVELDLGKQVGDTDDTKDTTSEKTETTKEVKEETQQTKVEDKKDITPEVDQSESYYGKLAKTFLSKGKWQDAEIETEEGTFKLSELDKVDEETFFAIADSQNKFNEDEIKNNYIKKEGFDENKLKIIEILKEGGDIKDIFASPEEAVRPFEGVDLEDSNIQKNVFFNYLTKVQNLNPEDAKVVLNNHDKRGELEGKVKEIVGGYQKNYDDNLTQKLEAIKAEKLEKEAKEKEFSKSLKEIYKNFDLDEKLINRFSSIATKKTQEGDYELDSLYAEKMEKPDEAADLIFFLTDKEGYLKSKMAETKIRTEQSHLKKINIVKDKQRKDDSVQNTPKDGRDAFIVDVDMNN